MKIDRSSWFFLGGGKCYATNCFSLFFWGPPMEVWYLDLRILLCVFFLVQCLNEPEAFTHFANQSPNQPFGPALHSTKWPQHHAFWWKSKHPSPSLPFLLQISDRSKINLLSNLEKFQIVVEFHSVNLSPRLKHSIIYVHCKCPLSSAYEICNSR
jgi:hypothetical protein